ncbi:MAG: GNAT family N-acetyltransferase [Nevskia sp.]|nr:GNAT family N-acetyltransferase [Nevskia sp.]
MTSDTFSRSCKGFVVEARLVGWDAEAFGVPVAQITRIEVADPAAAAREYGAFEAWVAANDVRIVSCRLPHERIAESMFLEGRDFRFIETVLHPQLRDLRERCLPDDTLALLPAAEAELPVLLAIAETEFVHGRYHVDPRLDPKLADRRYTRWVRTSLRHPSQRLLTVWDGMQVIGFFLVEYGADGHAYYHLHAIAPGFQGRGYGRRAWLAMLRHSRDAGVLQVTTAISASNMRILNLFVSLSARFLPSEMTFHWVRQDLRTAGPSS